jgi:hypothetical protein
MIHDSMYALGHLVEFPNVILHNPLLCGQQCPPSCYNIQKVTSLNSLTAHFFKLQQEKNLSSVLYN